jgi:hypothetical protein
MDLDLDLTPSPRAAEASPAPADPADGLDGGAPVDQGRSVGGGTGGTATPGPAGMGMDAPARGGRADPDGRRFQQAVRDLRERLKSERVTKRKVSVF